MKTSHWPLAAWLLLAYCLPLAAQDAPTIEKVRIGLPGGDTPGLSRNGAWAPIAVTLRAGGKGATAGQYRLVVASKDPEGLLYEAHAEVPAITPEAGDGAVYATVHVYAVPGDSGDEFTVRLQTKEGREVGKKAGLSRDPGQIVPDKQTLWVRAGMARRGDKEANKEKQEGEVAEEPPDSRFAYIDSASDLPDSWVGYGAVDVVVLGTSDPEFIRGLLKPENEARRDALREWVRRGGQLVLAVGSNAQEANDLFGPDGKMPLVAVGKIDEREGDIKLPALSTQWVKQEKNVSTLEGVRASKLVPGRGVITLVREADGPVLLEGACGLGRVLVFAFDLDSEAFGKWEGRQAFWKRLQDVVAPPVVLAQQGPVGQVVGVPPPQQPDQGPKDLREQLRGDLESFEEVTPLSFGYVALFILVYILLVGPLDYFILNRVFKRLELTWVTFPLTVIGVSVIVYFAASAMKGSDQRVNKIDLIDIDLRVDEGGKLSGQVYGHTWFTLFSPQAQSYTLGLEAAEGAWTGKQPEGSSRAAFLLTDGGERRRMGSQGLFSKPYVLEPNASGLRKVPVPVWSTRSGLASWRAPFPKKPPVGAGGGEASPVPRASADGGLSGKITNNLETALLDCCLFYRGRWYDLGKLAPGESKSLGPLFEKKEQGQNLDLASWFGSASGREPLKPGLPDSPSGLPINSRFLQGRDGYKHLKELMFYRQAAQDKKTTFSNHGLRQLDQSWRLAAARQLPGGAERWRDEAILVARTVMVHDKADVVNKHPASPSRLVVRIGDEPTERGYLTQESFVRVFIPIAEQRGP